MDNDGVYDDRSSSD